MTVPAAYVYNATVVRVVDGDTVEMTTSFGFFLYMGPVPVRLLGINSRELSEPGGKEAKAHLEGLLPPGTPVVLHTVRPDKYAPRWLAVVETVDLPDLSAYLVAQQWAAMYLGVGTKSVPPWPRTIG